MVEDEFELSFGGTGGARVRIQNDFQLLHSGHGFALGLQAGVMDPAKANFADARWVNNARVQIAFGKIQVQRIGSG